MCVWTQIDISINTGRGIDRIDVDVDPVDVSVDMAFNW